MRNQKRIGIFLTMLFVVSAFAFVSPVKSAENLLPKNLTTVQYPTITQYYPVNISITEDYQKVKWTIDAVGTRTLLGNGHWGFALLVSYDGRTPEYQIHNNDGTCSAYPTGTWLYSPYDKENNCWHTSDASWNTPVSDMDGISASGARSISANPDGIFTVSIDKNEKDIYFAIWVGVGGFYNPNNGYSIYPSTFVWGNEKFEWVYDYEYVEPLPTEDQVQARDDSRAVLEILTIDNLREGVEVTSENSQFDYNNDGVLNIADPFDQLCNSGLTWVPSFVFTPEAAQTLLRVLQNIYGENLENFPTVDGRVWMLYVLTYLPYT